MRSRAIPLLAAVLAGCGGTSYTYSGYSTWRYFPLDGERTWAYAPEGTDGDTGGTVQRLLVSKRPDTNQVGDRTVVTLEYGWEDPYELLWSIRWSSDSGDGILIHGYTVEGGEDVQFDPPVTFADAQMTPGETARTESGGTTFVSELVEATNCPNYFSSSGDWECLHFSVDDGGAGTPFAGDWWIATTWGAVWMQFASDGQKWILSEADYSPTE